MREPTHTANSHWISKGIGNIKYGRSMSMESNHTKRLLLWVRCLRWRLSLIPEKGWPRPNRVAGAKFHLTRGGKWDHMGSTDWELGQTSQQIPCWQGTSDSWIDDCFILLNSFSAQAHLHKRPNQQNWLRKSPKKHFAQRKLKTK